MIFTVRKYIKGVSCQNVWRGFLENIDGHGLKRVGWRYKVGCKGIFRMCAKKLFGFYFEFSREGFLSRFALSVRSE
jgi:hypothetical protein